LTSTKLPLKRNTGREDKDRTCLDMEIGRANIAEIMKFELLGTMQSQG
jgi:hypothetical protein